MSKVHSTNPEEALRFLENFLSKNSRIWAKLIEISDKKYCGLLGKLLSTGQQEVLRMFQIFLLNVFGFRAKFFGVFWRIFPACLSKLHSACLVELYEKADFFKKNQLIVFFQKLREILPVFSPKVISRTVKVALN